MLRSSFTYNEDFLVESHKRYKLSRSSNKIVKVTGIVAFTVLVPLSIATIALGSVVMGITILAFVLLAAYGALSEDWSLRRAMRKSPYKDDKIEITFTDENFKVESPIQNVSLSWKVFTKAKQFNDGCLIFQGDRLYNWIPSSSIDRGSKQELYDFLQLKIADYQIVEQDAAPNP